MAQEITQKLVNDLRYDNELTIKGKLTAYSWSIFVLLLKYNYDIF